MTWTYWLISGSLLAGLNVILGAFAAHALKARLSEYSLEVWETAVKYHMNHAIALVLIGLISSKLDSNLIHIAGFFVTAGILLFSGSLYTLALTNLKWLGMIAPIGGLCLILGWFLLGYAVFAAIK